MSKSNPLGVNKWLLQYLLTETTEKLPETVRSSAKDSLPKTQLVKVIKVHNAAREKAIMSPGPTDNS